MSERDHPHLREHHPDRSIWSADVDIERETYLQDHQGGWANDPRTIRRRIAEVLAQGALLALACAALLGLLSLVSR